MNRSPWRKLTVYTRRGERGRSSGGQRAICAYPECGKDGAAHGGFGRSRVRPPFPLRKSLREKHFETGNGGNSSLFRELKQLRFERAINHVHDEGAAELLCKERGDAFAWM